MTVARESSFRAAADKLCLSITPVNKGVHDLENYVGYKLFYRSSDGVKLTSLGLSLFNKLEPIIANLKKIQEMSKDTKKDKIKIAIGGFYIHEISGFVMDFYKKNNTVIQLINGCETNISRLLFNDDVDLFILSTTSNENYTHNDLIVKNIGMDELKIAVSKKILDSYMDNLNILKSYPLAQLATNVTPMCYGKILEYRNENNIHTPIFKMADLEQVLSLVNSGDAISFVPTTVSKIEGWNNYNIKLITSPLGQIPIYRKAYFRKEDRNILCDFIDKLKLH